MVFTSPPMLILSGASVLRVTASTPGTFSRFGTCSVS